jgi:hypothetical protein
MSTNLNLKYLQKSLRAENPKRKKKTERELESAMFHLVTTMVS